MTQGYLALVLHAHLPYVRHPEHKKFLEEDWFFEAMTETYVPLLHAFEHLKNDDVDFHVSSSILRFPAGRVPRRYGTRTIFPNLPPAANAS